MKSKIKQEQNLTNAYRTKKPFGIIDVIIITLLIIAIILSFVFLYPTNAGDKVIVYHEGEEIARYSLNNDIIIPILENKMYLSIENGYCFVKESDCNNQICVKSKKISKIGERIVCAPNKVTIVIEGKTDVIITGGVI